jgi:hypothetical protein
MNIKILTAHGASSNEALCNLTGITRIEITVEETAKLYHITSDRQKHQLYHEVELKEWTHLADLVRISKQNEAKEQTNQIHRLKQE